MWERHRIAVRTSTILGAWRKRSRARARKGSDRTVIISSSRWWRTTIVKGWLSAVQRRLLESVIKGWVTRSWAAVVRLKAATRGHIVRSIGGLIVAKFGGWSWSMASTVWTTKEIGASIPDRSVSVPVSDVSVCIGAVIVTDPVSVPVTVDGSVSVSVLGVSVDETTVLWRSGRITVWRPSIVGVVFGLRHVGTVVAGFDFLPGIFISLGVVLGGGVQKWVVVFIVGGRGSVDWLYRAILTRSVGVLGNHSGRVLAVTS
jgi:hypothetical protein